MKKKLILCLGVNELVEHKEVITEALKDRFGLFTENKEKMEVSVTYFPADQDQWRGVDESLSEQIFAAVDAEGFELKLFDTAHTDAIAKEYDAYYGSPSPLVPAFVEQKKPVMLADFGL